MTIPLSRAAAAALLTFLACVPPSLLANRAHAAPTACDGVNLVGFGGVLIDPFGGRIGCFAAIGAAIALTGQVGSAAELPVSSTMTYSYDAAGALVTSQDSGGNATTYIYDSLGRLSRTDEGDPPAPRVTYTYDTVDNRLETVESSDRVIAYVYDSMNRVIRIDDAEGGVTTIYEYDYDAGSRVQSVADPSPGGGLIYQYDYDGMVLMQATDGSGNVTAYVYDSQSRLTDIVVTPADPQLPPLRTAYEYDAMDRIIRTTYDADGNPITTQYQYDPVSGLMSGVDNATVLPLSLVAFQAAEPAALTLFGGGLLAFARFARRRRR